MSYDLSIRRPDGKAITFQEWRSCLGKEPDAWTIQDEISTVNPMTRETIKLSSPEGEPYTIWNGHPDRPKGITFMYGRGRIVVSGHALDATQPDDPCMAKMHELAKKLGARVVGQDGEIYTEDGKIVRSR